MTGAIAVHPALLIAGWLLLIVTAVALCVAARRGDEQLEHAMTEREVEARQRPRTGAVEAAPIEAPVPYGRGRLTQASVDDLEWLWRASR